MFFPGSRYAAMPQYPVQRTDGSTATAVRSPLPGLSIVRGYYRRSNGQRLDAIANYYLADPAAFWRLCDANNAVVPDTLANSDLVGIPLGAKIT
jgi:hypothetical protein